MDRLIGHRDAAGLWKIFEELPLLEAGRVAIGAFVDVEAVRNRNVIERTVME